MKRLTEKYPFRQVFVLVTLPLLVASCGTLNNGRGWGEDAIWPVEWERIPRAAYHALIDWQTLAPAAGALFFRIDHYDQRVSDWASEHHPLYGSHQAAETFSNSVLVGLYAETLGTALLTPSGDNPKEWAYSKMKGLAVEGAALGFTSITTSAIQRSTGRTRPDQSADTSFPSAHSSGAFSASTLSNRNLDSISIPNEARIPIQVTNVVLATADAWARVEGKNHYPSDVLIGAALGHFLSAFIHDAFIGLPEQGGFTLSVTPARGGGIAMISFSFD